VKKNYLQSRLPASWESAVKVLVVKRGMLARKGVGASAAGIAWAMLGCAVAWLLGWITARVELEVELAKELKPKTELLLACAALRAMGKNEV
jgi:hypothetical protein